MDDDDVKAALASALRTAMKERDQTRMSAFRSALAAIDNAEAVDDAAPRPPATHERIAGTVEGLGAAEVARRTLSEPERRAVVEAEVSDRLAAADEYDENDQDDAAQRLRAEALALAGLLGA